MDSSAFEIRLIPEYSCWISLPSSYSIRLMAAGATRLMPLIFQLSLLDSNGRESNPPVQRFVSWCGSVVSSPHAGSSVVEIPSKLAECLQLQPGMLVLLLPLFQPSTMPPTAVSVTLEPVTEDDWEVLEANASHVEEVMLQQTAVLAQGQLVPVWLRGQALIRLEVTSCQVSPSYNNGGSPLLANVVRLTDGCELHVAPKMRKRGDQLLKERMSLLREADIWEERVSWFRALPMPTDERWEGFDLVLTSGSEEKMGQGERLAAMRGGPRGAFLLKSLLVDAVCSNLPRGHALANPLLWEALGVRPGAHVECLLSKKDQTPNVQGDKLKELDPVEKKQAGLSFADGYLDRFAPRMGVLGAGKDEESTVPWLQPQLETCLHRLRPRLSLHWAFSCQRSIHQAIGNDLKGMKECMLLASGCGGGVLVSGAKGSGKTRLMASVANTLSTQSQDAPVHCILVHCSRIAMGSQAGPSKPPDKSPKDLKLRIISEVVREAVDLQPSLIILDDLDLLAGGFSSRDDGGGGGGSSQREEEKFAHWLSEVMDSTHSPPQGLRGSQLAPSLIAWAATAQDASDLHPVLRAAGRFDFQGGKGGKSKDHRGDSKTKSSNTSLKLPALGSEARVGLLSGAMKSRKVLLVNETTKEPMPPDEAKLVLERIAGHAEGCDASDLGLVVDRAVHHAFSDYISEKDLMSALSEFVPGSFWSLSESARGTRGKSKPEGGWSNVGGMSAARAAIKEALELPFKHAKLVANAPLRLRTGLLLFGPPGCGKTHLVASAAEAMSESLSMRFISVKGPELLNKYIGQSEAAVRDLFRRAASSAPCLLFFDEFDSIAPPRGHDSTGVTDRVVNQLLTELDGVEGLKGVCVMAATSRPDLIDPALLRPGRLDRLVLCDVPNEEERKEILVALSKGLALEPGVDLGWLAAQTEHLTGADLGSILSEAQLLAVHQVLKSGQGGQEDEAPLVVTTEHLHQALSEVRPSLPLSERTRLNSIYSRFGMARKPPSVNEQNRNEALGGEVNKKRATLA